MPLSCQLVPANRAINYEFVWTTPEQERDVGKVFRVFAGLTSKLQMRKVWMSGEVQIPEGGSRTRLQIAML